MNETKEKISNKNSIHVVLVNEVNYCDTCLSADRKSRSFTRETEIFQILSENNPIDVSELSICWECESIIRRFLLFKKQAKKALKKIQYRTNIQSFSRLRRTNVDVGSYIHEPDVQLAKTATAESEVEENDGFSDTDNECLASKSPPPRSNLPTEEYTSKRYFVTQLSENDMRVCRERESNKLYFVKSKFKCKSCIERFSSEALYKKHLKSHHVKRLFSERCDICSSYVECYQFESHRGDHYKLFTCTACVNKCDNHERALNDCGASFISFKSICRHLRREHKPTAYECKVCGHIACNSKAYKLHLKSHVQVECPKCGERVADEGTLKRHARDCRVTLSLHDMYCAQCDKYFKSVHTFRYHFRSSKAHIAESERKYCCNQCGKKYLNSYILKEHVNREHLKVALFPCDRCDQKFLTRKHLVRHIRRAHEKTVVPKDKMCDACGKGFSSTQVLKRHTYTHTGERPYKCQQCPATFTQNTSRMNHIKLVHLKMKRKIEGHKVIWEPKQLKVNKVS